MQDEEIDKLIKDAANQHHPPYDDTAWGKMEVMLDKHLPQKKDRRKPLLFLLFFFLLGGAVITAILQPWKSKQDIAENTKVKQPVTTKQEFGTTPQGNTDSAVNNNVIASTTPKQQNNTGYVAEVKNTVPGTAITKLILTKNNTGKTTEINNNTYQQKGRTSMKIKKPATGVYADENNPEKNNTTAEEITFSDDQILKGVSAKAIPQIAEEEKQNTATKTDTVNTVVPVLKETIKKNSRVSKEKKKPGSSFADKFAVTISAGVDVSYIAINNAGKLKPFYGTGLRYTIGKRFTISSGFYVSKKIYSARPSQYKFSGGTSYPYLQKINADCNVYEIPLNLYYSFKGTKNHNWFGGTGISSYLMKKETYDYIYKTPTGQLYNYIHTVNNENKHILAVLTLSGGYEYKLNNRFSFIAAPYIKLPLSGVGAGKVKLNSTGIIVTAAIKPFNQRRK